MSPRDWFDRAALLPGAPATRALQVSSAEWWQVAQDMSASGGRLLALWISGGPAPAMRVRSCYAAAAGLLVVELLLASAEQEYPGLEDIFPAEIGRAHV